MRSILGVFIITVFIITSVKGQEKILPRIVEDGDTLLLMHLKGVKIERERLFKNKRDRIRYSKLRRDVIKVYPYAKKTAAILEEIDKELTLRDKKKDKKKYLKILEKKLKNEFKDQLMNLTINQGKILIKLIDRETDHTCYYLIKELKSGFQAFIWQGVAKLFTSNLKYEYDPVIEKDIEYIVQSLENKY